MTKKKFRIGDYLFKYISNILEAINEKLNCGDGLKVRKKGNFRKAAGIEEQKC